MKTYKIAIDGPSGCGKSTVAKIIAKNQNLTFINSGILYRIAAYFLESETPNNFKEKLAAIKIEYKNDFFYANDIDLSKEIFANRISLLASNMAVNIDIRNWANDQIRKVAMQHNVIIDGRDIGTKVLLDANLKIYLTASVLTRVLRRKKELLNKNEKVNFFKLFKEIFIRDYNDKHRAMDPLAKASDAILIKSDNKTIDQVVKAIEKHIKRTGKINE